MPEASSNKRVTWVMAVKNGMPYLPETLESIRCQTYQNFEVLIWDNGSDDGTQAVLKDWVPNILPGRLVLDNPQANLATSLALCMEMCTTDLVARIDADDISFSDRLEHEIAYLEAHPEVAVVGGNTVEINSEGCVRGFRLPLPTDPLGIRLAFLWENPIAQPAVLLRRSVVLECGNYRNVGPVNVEDYDLWMRIVTRYRLSNLARPVLKYRVHERSTTAWAMQAGRLAGATECCLQEAAAGLFGCDVKEILLVRKGRHPAINHFIVRLAAFLSPAFPEYGNLLQHPVFLNAARRAGADVRRLHRQASEGDLVYTCLRTAKAIRDYLRTIRERREARSRLNRWIAEEKKIKVLSIGSRLQIFRIWNLNEQVELEASVEIGSDVMVNFAGQVRGGLLRVGMSSRIGNHSEIYIGEPILIGRKVILGSGTRISSLASGGELIGLMGGRQEGFSGVVIEDEVWIGAGVSILPGVTIGYRARVLAGSTVMESIPPATTWSGNPAKQMVLS